MKSGLIPQTDSTPACTPFLHTSAVAATCPPPHRRNTCQPSSTSLRSSTPRSLAAAVMETRVALAGRSLAEETAAEEAGAEDMEVGEGTRAVETGGEGRRVALVVGAGDGLGASIARRFASEGLLVCVVRRNGAKLALLVSQVRGRLCRRLPPKPWRALSGALAVGNSYTTSLVPDAAVSM
jgi:hypothetical protein